MKKLLIGFIVIGVFLVGGVTLFLITQIDESKVAEVIQTEEKILENTEPKKSKTVTKAMPGMSQNTLVKTGTFNYLDPLHNGAGKVEIIDLGDKYKIKMSSDFRSAEAPDPYVYLSSAQDFKDRAIGGVDTSKTINIGKLQSFNGEQEYLVSKKDFESHDTAVIIWCKKFGVQISRANLK